MIILNDTERLIEQVLEYIKGLLMIEHESRSTLVSHHMPILSRPSRMLS